MTTRVTLTFEDDKEAEYFADVVDKDYIYERFGSEQPLNWSVQEVVTVEKMQGGVWVPVARG